jgi:hypothetical protein
LTTVAGTLACQGNNNIIFQIGEPVIVLGPEHVETIAKDGFTKKDIKEFLFQKARLPKRAFSREHQELRFADFFEDALIPITRKLEDIIIVVAGGAGKHSMVIPTFGNTAAITEPIESVIQGG